jgi:transposase
VDESGTTLAMIRRYGRATPGQRVVDHVPGNSGDNYTMLAAIGLDGLHVPWVMEGAVNGDIFRYWGRHILCPTLRPGDIVLWDNLSAHKVVGVEEWLTAHGARLIRLSPYSPDFNPIEQCWSKIKTFLRRAKARTVEALIEAIKHALDTITETDIRGWFTHCGYVIHCYATRSSNLYATLENQIVPCVRSQVAANAFGFCSSYGTSHYC